MTTSATRGVFRGEEGVRDSLRRPSTREYISAVGSFPLGMGVVVSIVAFIVSGFVTKEDP